MAKIVNAEKEIKKKDNCACYVLISCTTPDEKGNMQVDMKYEGDETLAAFLVQNASQVFEDQVHKRESK